MSLLNGFLLLVISTQDSQPASSHAAPGPSIVGQVLGENGGPTAGARVRVFTLGTESLPASPWWSQRDQDAPREIAGAVTNDEGRFRVAVPEGYHLLAQAEHKASGTLSYPLAGFGAGDSLVLRLVPTRRLCGSVQRTHDGKSQPVANQLVWFEVVPRIHHPETPLGVFGRVRVVARTDILGNYHLDVPDTGQLERSVSTRLGNRVVQGISIVEQQELVQVGCFLLDEHTGEPIAGARLASGLGDDVVPAVSNATGWVETASSPGGFVQVIPPAHGRVLLSTASLRVRSHGDPLRVELRTGIKLGVRLLGADAAAVANARVRLFALALADNGIWISSGWEEQTSAEGRLKIGCLHPGRHVVGCVEVDGVWRVFLDRNVDQDLYLGDVMVAGTVRVDGRVLGPDGAPIAGALVHLLPSGDVHATSARLRSVVTNEVGRFTVPDLVSGDWSIAARSRSYGVALGGFDSGKPRPIVLELPLGASLAGHVVDADGKPVPHATVIALPWAPSEDAHPTAPWCDLLRFETECDQMGRFTLRGLSAGMRLRVTAEAVIGSSERRRGEIRDTPAGGPEVEIRFRQ